MSSQVNTMDAEENDKWIEQHPAHEDNYETIPDTNSTEDSEDDFCMEVHGNEEWVWDYENSGGDTV